MRSLCSPATFGRMTALLTAKVRIAICSRAMCSIKNSLIDEECLSGYRPSSYHPVKLGDVIHQLYTVKVKLGLGRSATTWLCTDQNEDFKVLKISTASDIAMKEARVLDHLRDFSLVSELQGNYFVRRPETIFTLPSNGQIHQCFVFEPLGPSLHEYALHRGAKGFHLDEVRFMIACLLHAVEFLHAHDVVHTDIKLDNIQLMLPDNAQEILASFVAEEEKTPSLSKLNSEGSTVYASREMTQESISLPILCDLGAAEFGQSCYSRLAQPLPYRAPEFVLGAIWDHKVDIWNLGVLIWEIVTGERLFGQSTEHHSLRLMAQYMGPPPRTLLERSSRNCDLFDRHRQWRDGELEQINLEDRVDFDATSLPFFDFLRSMLTWDPDEPLRASQLLDHPWLRAD